MRLYLERSALVHTDTPCEACAWNDRRRKTIAGRIGTLLMRLGQWMGGDVMRANASGTWT